MKITPSTSLRVGLCARGLRVAAVTTLTIVMAACGGADPVAPPPSEGSATIGTAGGVLIGPDGVVVTIPANVVTTATTFRIARDSTGAPTLPDGATALSPIYTVTPHIAVMSQAAEITIPIDVKLLDADTPPPLVLIAQPGGAWESLSSSAVHGGTVSALTVHFSYLVVVKLPVRFVSATLVLPQPLPRWGNSSQSSYPFFSLDAPLSARVDMTLSPAAFDRNARLYCRSDMTIVMEVWTLDGNGVTKSAKKTSLGPFSQGTTTSFEFALDSSNNGYTHVFLTEQCILTTGASGAPGGTFGPINTEGPVATFVVAIAPAPGAPIIAVQPQPTSVTAGQAANFSVTAGAAGALTTEWMRSNDGGNTWSSTGSAANPYTFFAVPGDDQAQFRAHLCDVVGAQQTCVDSAAAGLSVVPAWIAPIFTTEPGSVSVLAGQTASIGVSATGSPPPRVRIFRGNAPGGTLVMECAAPGSGSNAPCTYTTPALTLADSGAVFYATADSLGGTVTSTNATVTVSSAAAAPVIVTQPLSATAAVGGSASFSVDANGTAPLSYQWFFNGSSLSDRSAGASTSGISGSGASMLSLANVQATDAGAYSVLVSNGPGNVLSNNAALNVGAASCSGWCSAAPARYSSNQVAFGSAQTGIAVGNNLLRSTDGGASWQLLPTAFTGGGGLSTFYDVAFVDAVTVVIVGTDNTTGAGLIYRSTDAGTTWTLVATPTQVPTAVTFSGNLGLAMSFNTLLRSTDGGASWTTITPGYNLYAIAFPPPGVVALASVYNLASGAAELRQSIDGGQTWTLVAPLTGMSQWLRRMSFATSGLGIGVIGASNGAALIARTSDQGATWTIIDSGMPGYFSSVLLTPQGVGLAVGSSGEIARSTDSGTTWSAVNSSSTANLRGVATSAAGVFTAVGDGNILHNTTGGGGPASP